MVNVECKECPIRNFCPVPQLEEQQVIYDKCPLFKAAQQTRTFFNAVEKIGKDEHPR